MQTPQPMRAPRREGGTPEKETKERRKTGAVTHQVLLQLQAFLGAALGQHAQPQ